MSLGTNRRPEGHSHGTNQYWVRACRGALSDLTGHRISLEVPSVSVHLIAEISPMLQRVITEEVASVNQVFAGAIAGNAILLLDKPAVVLEPSADGPA